MDSNFLAQLTETLRQVTLPDSAAIKRASKRLQTDFYPHQQSLPALVHIMQTDADTQIRQLAAVELRKLIKQYWDDEECATHGTAPLPEQVKADIRGSLLASTLAEQNPLVRHASARVISTAAQIDLAAGHWGDLLPELYKAALTTSESDAPAREVALYIIYTLLEVDSHLVVESTDELLQLFSRTVADNCSVAVRVTTVQAVGALAEAFDEETSESAAKAASSTISLFRQLVPQMAEVLRTVLDAEDSDSARKCFDVFNSMLYLDSALLAKHLADLIRYFLAIATDVNRDDDVRLAALQFLISCVKVRKNRVQSLKLGPEIVAGALNIAAEIGDEETSDEDLRVADDVPYGLALSLLEALASALPPRHAAAPLVDRLGSALQGSVGEQRAILLAVGVAVDGAPDYIATRLPEVLPAVLGALQHGTLPVRIAALQCTSELAVHLTETVAAEHAVLVPVIFELVQTATTAAVCRSACEALDGILEYLPRRALTEQYLSTLMPSFLHMFSSTEDPKLRQAIVSAIGSAAFAAGKGFAPFFPDTIQVLQPFVYSGGSTDNLDEAEVELSALALETIPNLAAAVGKSAFAPYAAAVVDAAYAAMQTDQSRLREAGFSVVAPIAKMFGPEFAPFLDRLLPEVYKCLDQLEYSLKADDEDAENSELADLAGQEAEEDFLSGIHINGGLAIEKEIAAEALGDVAAAVGAAFGPHMPKAVSVLSDLLEHFYDGVRRSAVRALFNIAIAAFKLSGATPAPPGLPLAQPVAEDVAQLLSHVRRGVLTLLEQEDERAVVTTVFAQFVDALKAIGPALIAGQSSGGGNEDLESLCNQVMAVLLKQHLCQTVENEDEAEAESGTDGTGEAEAEAESSEYDEVLVDSALDVLAALSSALGDSFGKILPHFAPILFRYCQSRSRAERVAGVGALAEIVLGLKSAVTPLTEDILGLFEQRLGDGDLEVRSNAAYGAGLVCYYSEAEELVKGRYVAVLQKLQKLLARASREERKLSGVVGDEKDDPQDTVDRSYANACGCVARMILRHPEWVPVGEVVPVLLSKLPLQSGLEENTPVWELLMQLYKQQEPTVVAATGQLVAVLSHMFTEEENRLAEAAEATEGSADGAAKQFETEELKATIVEFLKYLESTQPGIVSSQPVLARVIQ